MFSRSQAILALTALAVAATSAEAAPVAAPTPPPGRAVLLIPLRLTKIQDLSFGSVVPSGMSGTVAINATTGTRTIAGGITGLPSDVGQRAQFAGAGSPNQLVILSVTPPANLTSVAGDTLPVLALTLDGLPTRTISATRAFYFGVGGIIMVNANQPEGVYTSTYDVTANYL